MSPDRIAILRCPDTGASLVAAEPRLIERLNALVTQGRLHNRAGRRIEKRLDGGLVRQGGDLLYPIIDQIPILLKDEAIPVANAGDGDGKS